MDHVPGFNLPDFARAVNSPRCVHTFKITRMMAATMPPAHRTPIPANNTRPYLDLSVVIGGTSGFRIFLERNKPTITTEREAYYVPVAASIWRVKNTPFFPIFSANGDRWQVGKGRYIPVLSRPHVVSMTFCRFDLPLK